MVFSMRLKYGERILKHGESTFKHEWRYGGMIFKHGELRWKHYHGMVMSTVLGLRLILYIHATSLPLRSPRQETQPKTLPRRRRWRSPDLSLPLWLYLASKSNGEWGILRDVTSSSISSMNLLPVTHGSRDSDSLFLCRGLFWTDLCWRNPRFVQAVRVMKPGLDKSPASKIWWYRGLGEILRVPFFQLTHTVFFAETPASIGRGINGGDMTGL